MVNKMTEKKKTDKWKKYPFFRFLSGAIFMVAVCVINSLPVYAETETVEKFIDDLFVHRTDRREGKGRLNVLDFGAIPNDGIDDTLAFNIATGTADNYLDGGYVFVPAGEYDISCNNGKGIELAGTDKLEIELDPNAHIKVTNVGSGNYGVFHLRGCKQIYIHGGSIDGERDRHSGDSGEWGMGIEVLSSKDVTISNMTIQDNWGDGIYLGRFKNQYRTVESCNGVRITNCTIKNNRRSNVSVVACDNLTIDNCYIANARGTAPQCGINIEPNADANKQVPYEEVCGNIKILNTTIDTCGMGDPMGQFFCFMNHYNPNMESRHTSDNIEITDCTFNGDCGNYSGTNTRFNNTTIKGTFYDTHNTKLNNTSYGSIWQYYACTECGNAITKPLGKNGVVDNGSELLLQKDGYTCWDYSGIYNDDQNQWWIVEKGIATKIDAPKNIDQVKEFTARLYTVALGREYDAAGLDSWVGKLVSGKMTGAEVAQGFFFSAEFTNKNLSDSDYVDTLYRTMFGREADADGKATWMKALNNGMSREFVYHGFAEGEEFKNLCESFGIKQGTVALTQNRDKNEQLTAFVARNYTKALGRNAEEAGINDWTGRILEGKATPADVTAGFIFSDEFINKNLSNEEFLNVLYQTYFDRDPDADGFNGWIEQLNNGVDRKYVVNTGFSCSQEFKNLVASFGL